ncbi:MAG: kinase/pyrophosphorylase [Alphaproteobacteria bacterium]|nr:kinase/pyrophosphorylase [Alphaproteobacteria bacterium]MCZ6763805.1 kinase/pyrophosphorylase [Alphaproteobacteria bacterium]
MADTLTNRNLDARQDTNNKRHLHLVSDSTGETINSVMRACMAQFDDGQIVEHMWPMARTPRAMELVLDDIRTNPGIAVFTLVDEALREQLVGGCGALGVPCISVLDPVIDALGSFLGAAPSHRPGRQHIMDADYFARIEAMEWVLAHDDGQGIDELDKSDVVLVGVSRTSKTPTCLYLGNRGIRAANVPIVPEVPLPPQLDAADRAGGPRIVALTKNPKRLVEIRKARLVALSETEQTDYIDPDRVKAETAAARRLFAKNKWPVIDVSHRSIEETASSVIQILSEADPRGIDNDRST